MEITIVIGDEECTAELLTEQAPRTCQIIENALPLKGMATHAKLVDHMRSMAMQGGVDLKTMKVVTEPYLEFHAGVYGNFYQFADTAQVVRQAEETLAGVKTLEEYAAVISELAMYLNRMDYWVDLKIPWAKFGQVFEQELSPHSNGKTH